MKLFREVPLASLNLNFVRLSSSVYAYNNVDRITGAYDGLSLSRQRQ